MRATARAYSNIAFIKYWGNRDENLRLPQSPSLSMNLNGLYTQTTVVWHKDVSTHTMKLNGNTANDKSLQRVSSYLEQFKGRYGVEGYAHVESMNNFPTGVGIASSASAFAALALAATTAANLDLTERDLSALARLGSGSASRSIPGGFVEWHAGDSHETSFAETFAPVDHWGLVDVIAIVSSEHKTTGSTEGHKIAPTSDLQKARLDGAAQRLSACKNAVLERDFERFAEVVELDSNLMHAVMMTSRPSLFYWQPASIQIMQFVREWRQEGIPVCYTLDAGPNVHCLCLSDSADEINKRLSQVDGVQDIKVATAGGAAQVITTA